MTAATHSSTDTTHTSELAELRAENAALRARVLALEGELARARAQRGAELPVDAEELLAAVPAYFYVYDLETRASLYQSRSLHELLGIGECGAQNLPRAEWETPMHPDDVARLDEYHARLQALAPGQQAVFVYRTRRADGSWRWLQSRDVRLAPKPGRRGQLVAGMALDITEQRAASDALRVSREQLASVLRAAPVGIALLDEQLRYLQINDALAAGNGVPAAEHLGRTPRDVLGDYRADLLEPLFQHVLTTGEPLLDHEVSAIVDGRERCYIAQFVPVPNATPSGGTAVSCVVVDISARQEERRRAEEALRDDGRRKDEFLAMLAHELRNPLAPITSSVSVMRARALDDPLIERCRVVIERQAAQMSRLLDDLLDVSRLARGVVSLHRERVSLASVLEAAQETSQPMIDKKGHLLTVPAVDPELLLHADPARLTQVFANLLNNAARYSAPGSSIEVRVRRTEGRVEVAVHDTGIGIAPEMLSSVFELFVQTSDARSHAPGGLGLGLTLAKSLVEMHGGQIRAESPGRGRGSTFTVTLPLAEPEPVPAQASRRVAAPVPACRVLVTDDNVDAADSLAVLLGELGCEVKAVYGGEEALREAATFRPDLLLLDLGMPGLDGFETCRRLRSQPWGRTISVIAVSGWAQDEDRRRSRAVGFDHHLMKPVDLEVLLEVIRQRLGPPS